MEDRNWKVRKSKVVETSQGPLETDLFSQGATTIWRGIFSQNSAFSDGDAEKIIALENLWNQIQINHDADAMAKMLHSDFVFTDYDGTVMSEGAFLASRCFEQADAAAPGGRYGGGYRCDAREGRVEGET